MNHNFTWPKSSHWFTLSFVLALIDVTIASLSNQNVLHWTPLQERLISPIPFFWPLIAALLGIEPVIYVKVRSLPLRYILLTTIVLFLGACYVRALQNVPSM